MNKAPSAINIYRGLSIFKVANSQYWQVRVWDRKKKKYLTRSTGETSSIKAKQVAVELGLTLLQAERLVETEFTFKHFAIKLMNQSRQRVQNQEQSEGYFKSTLWALQNEDWGLVREFGDKDVRKLRTVDYQSFIDRLSAKRPDITPSTKNTLMAAFRNVLKVARDEAVIDVVPATPRTRQKDNPRPFFRFHPLISKEEDVYKKMLDTAQEMATTQLEVRGATVTEELYDLILFLTHSFVRPTTTELYALKHNDVTIADNPKRLILTVRNGKTGYRSANTMEAAVSVYKRIQERYPDAGGEDYLFLPHYENRTTASKFISRQFNSLLKRADIERDIFTGKKHTLYSLRHTAICMRITLSGGKVNIYNLAKNAGTSVDQIERFYAKHLPLSREMAVNLQSFGDS